MWAGTHFLHFLEIALTAWTRYTSLRTALYLLARLAPGLLSEGSAKLEGAWCSPPRTLTPGSSRSHQEALGFIYGEARPLDADSFFLSTAQNGGHAAIGGRNLLYTCVNPDGGSCPTAYPFPACCTGSSCTAYFYDFVGCGSFGCASSLATKACCADFDYYSFCPKSDTKCHAPGSGSGVTCGTGFYSNEPYIGCCDTEVGTCGTIYSTSCELTCPADSPSCCNKFDAVYSCSSTPTTPAPPASTPAPPVPTPAPPVPTPAPPAPTPAPPAPTPAPPAPTPAPPVPTPAPPVPTPAPPVPTPAPPAPTPGPPEPTPAPPVPTPAPPVPTPAPPVPTPAPPVPTPAPPVSTPAPPVPTPAPPAPTTTAPVLTTPAPTYPVVQTTTILPPVIAPALPPPTPIVSTTIITTTSSPGPNSINGVATSTPSLQPPPSDKPEDKSGSNIGVIAGAVGATGAGFAVVAALALWCILKSNKKRSAELAAGKLPPGGEGDPKDAGYEFVSPPVLPRYDAVPPAPISTGGASTASRQSAPLQGVASRVFSYEELLAVTNGFNAANLIGQGGFSRVYQGTLADGTVAAVKVLRSDQISGPDDAMFISEMAVMSRLRHKYLLAMLGYASAGTERVLVLELCRGGNLYDALHGPYKLDWNKRLRTALDVTIGLEYLHEGVDPPIFHRDIKSANVLFVDETRSVAKLSDFGVAKYEEGVQPANTRVLGTQGYVAPEYAQSGQITKSSDVYSHGVLLAEIITGRQCIFQNGTEIVTLRNWVVENKHLPLALVDPALGQNFHPQQIIGLVQLAVECLNQDRPKARPTMSQIKRRIEELINVTAAPPPTRAPFGASQALSTSHFNTSNIPVAQVAGGGPPTGSSLASGPPHSGGSSSFSESYGGLRSGPSGPPSSELNMTVLHPMTGIQHGR